MPTELVTRAQPRPRERSGAREESSCLPLHADERVVADQVEGFFGILGKQSLGVAHFPSKDALRDHIDAYIAHWSDNPTPFIWTKPASSIIRPRKRMLDRTSHAVHTAPLAKTLVWEHVGSEAGRSS
jgi:hypothetical protein